MRPITGPFVALLFRCAERGYTLREIEPCILHRDGEMVTADVDHPAYPRHAKTVAAVSTPSLANDSPAGGPGTELKALLRTYFGINATPNCSCNARAKKMDEMEAAEPGWCDAHLDEIVGWLREEAESRRLPFVDMAGRLLVKRAIKNARKKSAGK
jgi:hypothetical protein